MDLTSHKQDVVQIAIELEFSLAKLFQNEKNSSMYLDNSYTIEIEAKGFIICMSKTNSLLGTYLQISDRCDSKSETTRLYKPSAPVQLAEKLAVL